jgi:hypothetical protein
MQSHSMTELEIESVQSHQRPDADMYQPDSGNHAMVRGRGLNPRTHLLLELGSQQHRGQAYDQRRGDRSEQPPSPAGSKRNHRRKDATAGARAGWRASGRTSTICRIRWRENRQPVVKASMFMQFAKWPSAISRASAKPEASKYRCTERRNGTV